MDVEPRPDLFVSQTPFVNAGAYGMDRPFIVINSGALKLLDDDEMRTLLGHELGHVMSGHALYVTILILILNFSFSTLPFLAGIGPAAHPDRPARVVPEERALVRSRGSPGGPGSARRDAHASQDGRRRRYEADEPR